MDLTEDLSARVLLNNILSTEPPRTPITRSAPKAQSPIGIRRSSRLSKKNAGAQTPQQILRRSMMQKVRESITRKSLPATTRRMTSSLLPKANTPGLSSMLFDSDDTPRHILRHILQTEPVRSPVVNVKAASEEPHLPSANSSKRSSIELSGLDLPDLTLGNIGTTAKGLNRKRPRRSLNVTAFEKRLKDASDFQEEHEESAENYSSLSLSSSTSLSLKTPFVDVRSEKKGLQRRVSNRRKITEEEFGAAVNKRQMGHGPASAVELNHTTLSEGFTLGLSSLSEPNITTDIVNCNTALYTQPDPMTSTFSIMAIHDKATVMASQLQRQMTELEQSKFGQDDTQFALPTEDGVLGEPQIEECAPKGQVSNTTESEEKRGGAQTEEESAADIQTEEEEEEEDNNGELDSQPEDDVEARSQSEEEEAEPESERGEGADGSQSGEDVAAGSQTEEEEAEPESEREEGADGSQSGEDVAAGSQTEEEEAEPESERGEGADGSESGEDVAAGSQTEEEEAEPESEREEGADGSQSGEDVEAVSQTEEEEAECQSERDDEGAADSQFGEGVELGSQTKELEDGKENYQHNKEDPETRSQSEEDNDVAESQDEYEHKEKEEASEQLEHISRRTHLSQGGLSGWRNLQDQVKETGLSKVHSADDLHISLETGGHDDSQPHSTTPDDDDDDDAAAAAAVDPVEQEDNWEDEDDDGREFPCKTPAFVREKMNFVLTVHQTSPSVLGNIQTSSTSEAIPAAKPKQVPQRKRGPAEKQACLPKSYLMNTFRHFAKTKVSSDVYPILKETMDQFFDRLADDLESYAGHAKRKTIEFEDTVLLLKRLGYVNDKVPVEVLIEKYLRMDQRKLLIPIATSGNVVVPKQSR